LQILTSLILAQPNASRTLYALRVLDRDGSGWVKTPIKSVTKLTGLSVPTTRRHLAALKELGWLFDYETKGTDVWCRYASHRTLKKKNNGIIGIGSKASLKDRDAWIQRATLASVLSMQHVVEANAIRQLRSTDIKLVDSNFLTKKFRSSQGVGGCREVKAYIKDENTFGLSMNTFGKRLGVSDKTISKRLKGTKRVRILKQVDVNVFANIDDPIECAKHLIHEDGSIYKLCPYVYLDMGYTHKKHRAICRTRRARTILNAQRWEVAKLAAICKFGEYSDEAADRVIESTGLGKFMRNTYALDKLTVSPTEYLEELD
jgi:DNA-binding Lrp family transcriptional regulator